MRFQTLNIINICVCSAYCIAYSVFNLKFILIKLVKTKYMSLIQAKDIAYHLSVYSYIFIYLFIYLFIYF